MSDYIFTLYGRAICWKSFKQHIVADSTWEGELIAASNAANRKKNLIDFFTKALETKEFMTTNRRWVLDTVLIGFSLSESY